MTGAPFESVLPKGVDAPRVARRLLADWFAPTLNDGTLAAAKLLVSELVTNAVIHGRGRVTLRAQMVEHHLLVDVIDEGDGFECELRRRDLRAPGVGGWGLSVVDAESSHWGLRHGRSHVWFELEPRCRDSSSNRAMI